jgi:thioesterase DpgC
MSLGIAEFVLKTWLQKGPSLTGIFEADQPALARYTQDGEALLDLLGPRQGRTCEEARDAQTIHSACRALRRRFLACHAEDLYRRLTDDFTVRMGLRDLAFAAAELCRGLVPTREQIARERSRLQCDKEGYEIDQGIFFHGLLRSQQVGTHLMETALQPTPRALELIGSFRNRACLDLGSVLIERQGCAAHLTINNAYCLNAEDDRLVEDMETAVDLALLDDEVRVGVLRGGVMTHPRYAGRRVFSAGINLKALHTGQISFVDFLLRRELGYINKIVRGLLFNDESALAPSFRIHQSPRGKQWIAVVESFAIGGGAQLLLVCDRVIAEDGSYFSLPAAQEGIVPGFANLRLGRFLGSRGSREVILYGRKISTHHRDAGLLFDESVSPEAMDAAIERNVQQLSSPAVTANRHMLNLVDEPTDAFLRYACEFALLQSERLYSRDVLDKVRNTAH